MWQAREQGATLAGHVAFLANETTIDCRAQQAGSTIAGQVHAAIAVAMVKQMRDSGLGRSHGLTCSA